MNDILHFLLQALASGAVLAGGWLAATVLRRLVGRLLVRAGLDRAAFTRFRRSPGDIRSPGEGRWPGDGRPPGEGRWLGDGRSVGAGGTVSDVVAKLVFYATMFAALRFAFGIWGPNPVSALLDTVLGWLPRAFVAIVIVVVAAAIARAVKDIIASALGGAAYGNPLAVIAYIFFLGLGVIAALDQLGVATTITTPVLLAVLATVGGVVGGVLARPLQDRWAARARPVIAEQTSRAARQAPGRVPAPQGEIEREHPESVIRRAV